MAAADSSLVQDSLESKLDHVNEFCASAVEWVALARFACCAR